MQDNLCTGEAFAHRFGIMLWLQQMLRPYAFRRRIILERPFHFTVGQLPIAPTHASGDGVWANL